MTHLPSRANQRWTTLDWSLQSLEDTWLASNIRANLEDPDFTNSVCNKRTIILSDYDNIFNFWKVFFIYDDRYNVNLFQERNRMHIYNVEIYTTVYILCYYDHWGINKYFNGVMYTAVRQVAALLVLAVSVRHPEPSAALLERPIQKSIRIQKIRPRVLGLVKSWPPVGLNLNLKLATCDWLRCEQNAIFDQIFLLSPWDTGSTWIC